MPVKQLSPDQIEKKSRFDAMIKQIAAMCDEEREALAARSPIVTIEQRPLSARNQCLIAMQRPSATIVGGFRQWLNAGRCVRKGEKGLTILVPAAKKGKPDQPAESDSVWFMRGTVFDISQTAPTDEPRDETPPSPTQPITPKPRQSDAGRFHAMACAMREKIADLERPRLENTPKRNCQGMARRCEAANLERAARAAEAIGNALMSHSLPAQFASITTRKQIEQMTRRIIEHPSYYVVCEGEKFADESDEAQRLRNWVHACGGMKQTQADAARAQQAEVQKLEDQIRFQPIPGFFPTPPAVIRRLLEFADIRAGMTVLEPSAGKGDIVAEIQRIMGGSVSISCCEIAPKLRELIALRCGVAPTGDFFDHFGTHDRIVMNPPFEKLQDIEHVRHAYKCLAPGGRLVSIMSASVKFNQRAQSFRDWLDELDADIENVPEDAFKGQDAFRQTGVQCIIVTIDKPA